MIGIWPVLGVLIGLRFMPAPMKQRFYLGLQILQTSTKSLLLLVILSWIALGIREPTLSISLCVTAFFVARGASSTERMPTTIALIGGNIAAFAFATMVAPIEEIIKGLVTGIWVLILFLIAKVITNLVNEIDRSRSLRAATLLFVTAGILQVLPGSEVITSLFVIAGIFCVALAICWTNDQYVELPPFLELRDSDGNQPMFGTFRRRK